MINYEGIRKETYDAVVGRPFTRIPGLPTWEQKETFLEEAEEISMKMAVSYDWAEDHRLLPEIIGHVKFLSRTTKNYVAPNRPPVVPPAVLNQTATDKEAKIFMAENDQMKMNCAVTEGFWSGFNHNFRNAFDKKYCEQLH